MIAFRNKKGVKIWLPKKIFTVKRMLMRVPFTVVLFFVCTRSIVSAPIVYAEGPARYQGTGSCSSSNCHGNVHAIKGSDILQNEYYTWLKHDSHSKAYTVLTQPDAKRMAKHLGLGDPTGERICLECHSTYVPDKARRGDRYTIEDGVSCESCHGPAEHWLSSHPEEGATHEQNIRNGLADTVSLEKRATLCLSCHFGDESKRVTHDLYGAGHPRLRFELDTYGILQPKHWIVDQDYKTRKEEYVPLRAFLIGQATQAESLMKMLLNPHTAKKGLFPELSLFDCFSCHHDLSQEQWKDRSYAGEPGRLHVNLTPILLLQGALGTLDPTLVSDLGRTTEALNARYQQDGAAEVVSELAMILSKRAIPALRRLSTDSQTCVSVAHSLAAFGSNHAPIKFELAEQIGMGIQAAFATSPELAKRYAKELKALFSTIENADTFKLTNFVKALAPLQK